MTNQGESVGLSQSTQCVGQMTSGNTKEVKLTHCLVDPDTGLKLDSVS